VIVLVFDSAITLAVEDAIALHKLKIQNAIAWIFESAIVESAIIFIVRSPLRRFIEL